MVNRNGFENEFVENLVVGKDVKLSFNAVNIGFLFKVVNLV